MTEAGVDVWVDTTHTATIGFLEPLLFALPLKRMIKKIMNRMDSDRPDLIVCIDSPKFNLKLAEQAAAKNIPVVYYITPQEFFWGIKKSALKIMKYCKQVINIDPKGYEFYKTLGANNIFVGHPLLDAPDLSEKPDTAYKKLGIKPGAGIIGLFLGSRQQEIKRIAPTILKGAALLQKKYPHMEFVAPCSTPRLKKTLEEITTGLSFPIRLIDGENSVHLMHIAKLIITKSGTTTLEAAIRSCPMVTVYKVNPLTYQIAIRIIRIQDKIKYISLPNLYLNKMAVPELIQNQATPQNILTHCVQILNNQSEIRETLEKINDILGTAGASNRAAKAILDFIK